MKDLKVFKTLEFTSPVYKEYSMSKYMIPLGERKNIMTVYGYDSPSFIEWIVEASPSNDYDDEIVEEIGMEFEGMTLVDYDGVFEFPKQAIPLMEELGYNMDYVKDDVDY
jgi:hypothetical protein